MNHHLPPTQPRRRRLSAPIATASVALLALSACAAPSGSPSAAAGDPTPVELRMSTWGNDSRLQMTEEALDIFEADNPGITVTLENSAYGAYWDKLATQYAAKDAPDVIQLDEVNFSSYAERGVLVDLAGLADALPLADISPAAAGTGQVAGTQYGLPMGLTILGIAANPTLFEKAGIALPDDKTWTWGEYYALGKKLSDALPEGEWGISSMGLASNDLVVMARQKGEEFFPGEGQDPLTEATVKEYFDHALALATSGAAPVPSIQVESSTAPLDTNIFATNKAAMGLINTAQVASYSRAAGVDFKLLRMPALEPGQHHMAHTASQWTINAQSQHQAEAAKLISFLLGNEQAAEILTNERGIPAVPAIRSLIGEHVDAHAKEGLDFAEAVDAELVAPSSPAPAGASGLNADFTRIGTDVLFQRMTTEEAAKAFVEAVEAAKQ